MNQVDKQHGRNGKGKPGGVTGKGFMPGKSGNPSGRRPLAVTLAQHVRDIGSEVAKEELTRLDLVLRRLYSDAAQGGRSGALAAKLILERGWGKPIQPTMELSQMLLARMKALGLTLEDVRTDPVASELFRLAGVDLGPDGAGGGTPNMAVLIEAPDDDSDESA